MSAALLSLISALFMGAVLPALQREDWFFNSQDHLRNFIAAKEAMTQRLRDSRLVPADSDDYPDDPNALLVYQRPVERDTEIGVMPDITRSEAATWNPTIYTIRRRPAGLVESVEGGDDRRLLWRLAEGDQVNITLSPDQRLLTFAASGAITSQKAGGASGRWDYLLRVRLR